MEIRTKVPLEGLVRSVELQGDFAEKPRRCSRQTTSFGEGEGVQLAVREPTKVKSSATFLSSLYISTPSFSPFQRPLHLHLFVISHRLCRIDSPCTQDIYPPFTPPHASLLDSNEQCRPSKLFKFNRKAVPKLSR